MVKKKLPQLDEDVLFEMGMAEQVQQSQLFDLSGEAAEIEDGVGRLEEDLSEVSAMGNNIRGDLEDLLNAVENGNVQPVSTPSLEDSFKEYEANRTDNSVLSKYDIRKTKEVLTNNNWDTYYRNLVTYSKEIGIDENEDPFLTMLSPEEYQNLSEEVDGEFSKKTSIKNKLDLKFLAIAVALEVAKGLLFPVVSDKLGYGQSFDPDERLAHNDRSIEASHRQANDKFRDKNIKKHGKGEWIEYLYRTVPYDITRGTGDMMDINLHAGDHRLYTLGHDPILGWIFGTANILTDVITISPGAVVGEATGKNAIARIAKVATLRSYRATREPKMMVTPERVSLPQLFRESYEVVREDPMNLPAAIFAEGQHLKSDINTKKGLPVPVVETFAPDFASNLYKEHYDALCFARDVKIIGKSAAISILIDTIIGLVHGLYYDSQKDGSRDLFEVRTRKILLIANTIGTSSNLIAAYLTQNAKGVDIGGLLVTIAHLFRDMRFLLNVKKEFVENRIYEKISGEIEELNKIEEELMRYGYQHSGLYTTEKNMCVN